MPNHSGHDEPTETLNRTFAALADPTRRAMLVRLVGGPVTVSQLAEPVAMSLPAVMQHLTVLETAGLIRTQKHGRVRTCQAESAALREAERWLADQRTGWETRLDALATTLPTPPRRSP